MGQVKSATEAGVSVGYGPVTLVARRSLGGDGPKGTQADLVVEYPWVVSDRLSIRTSLGATWADRKYMQTYFGVSAAQAQATTFAAYTPTSGCRKVELGIGAEYALAPNWTLLANLGFSQLGDEAAASPLVGRRNGVSAVLGVARTF
jgi:outer membrane scaffolding protein for murein synthesis (MipA/OmpV family)